MSPPNGPTTSTTSSSKPVSISIGISSSSSSSLSLAAQQPRKDPAAVFTQKKRPFAHDSDSDGDDDDAHTGKVQLVSAFDHKRGGAVFSAGSKKDAGPMVIPALKNRDWRAEAMKKKHGAIYIPPDARQEKPLTAEELTETVSTEGQVFGLQTFDDDTGDKMDVVVEEKVETMVVEKKVTEDDAAIAALMGGEAKRPEMVITGAGDSNDWRNGGDPENEDDAYRRDLNARPEAPSLDDYAAVPVEEFGAALLRGMGWKGGDELHKGPNSSDPKKKKRAVEKRPAFLGIGAKPQSEIPELGAWGKGDKNKKKGRRVDTTYVPVVMIDKKTGKIVEEEPKTKEELMKESWKPKVNNMAREGVRGNDRDQGEGRGGSDRRDQQGSSRRDRDRGQDREREWDRDRDSGRRRDGDRDRDRDRDSKHRRDGGNRDRDRDRDHRHRRENDSNRDRDRDRDYKHRDRDEGSSRRGRDEDNSRRDRDHDRRDRDRDRDRRGGDRDRDRRDRRY